MYLASLAFDISQNSQDSLFFFPTKGIVIPVGSIKMDSSQEEYGRFSP